MNNLMPLKSCCHIELSSIDKKSKPNEKEVKLCNFTDVYYNWNIYPKMVDGFMTATASDNNIKLLTLKKGDVVITKDSETRDDIGMSAYVYDDLSNTVLGYHCALIRPSSLLDGAYLNAYLNSSLGRKYFENQASGSGQRYTLAKESIGSIKIPVLSIKSQEKIGAIFNNIDLKICNNTKSIAELESLAKTIYDYWFLQFEFPNEEGKPYKSSGGKMVWNEELKREIPEGWEVKKYLDIGETVTGKEDANFATKNGKYAYFTCGSDILKCDEYKFDGKAILVAGNGDFNVKYYDGKFNAYQRTYVMMPKEKYIGILYQATIRKINSFKSGSNGSIVKFITKKDIENIEIAMPNNDGMLSIFNIILDKIQHIKIQNQQLTELRDFLLPMLMNGQVTFKDESTI